MKRIALSSVLFLFCLGLFLAMPARAEAQQWELSGVALEGGDYLAMKVNQETGEAWHLDGDSWLQVEDVGNVPAGSYELTHFVLDGASDCVTFRTNTTTGQVWRIEGTAWVETSNVQPTTALGLPIASNGVLRTGEILPLTSQLAGANGEWTIVGYEGWFALAVNIPPDTAGFYHPFGVMPAAAQGKALFMKLGDEEDGETGFYIFYRDANQQQHIVWHSPETYPLGSELRVQDSGRLEFIGTDGEVEGFYLGLEGGWEKMWQTGSE